MAKYTVVVGYRTYSTAHLEVAAETPEEAEEEAIRMAQEDDNVDMHCCDDEWLIVEDAEVKDAEVA